MKCPQCGKELHEITGGHLCNIASGRHAISGTGSSNLAFPNETENAWLKSAESRDIPSDEIKSLEFLAAQDAEIERLKAEVKGYLVFDEPPTDLEWEIIKKRLQILTGEKQ